MKKNNSLPVLTLDLGATDTKIALFENAKISKQVTFETEKKPKELIEKISSEAKKLIKDSQKPIALGVGAAGYWDENCILKQSINLPTLIDHPIWEKVSENLELPLLLKSDVELAVMGEAIFGLKNKYSNVLYINMGTGFSGGLYKDGEIFTTAHSPTIRLSFMVQPELVSRESGNEEDQSLQSIAILSSTVVNLTCILAPEIIVFGGGKVKSHWNTLIEPALSNAKKYLDQVMVYKIKFDKAKLEYPTLYGAYELVCREFKINL